MASDLVFDEERQHSHDQASEGSQSDGQASRLLVKRAMNGIFNGGNWQKEAPIIIAIIFQTATAIWWASGINVRVAQLERQVEMAATQGERIARLETKIGDIDANVTEIKQFLKPQK